MKLNHFYGIILVFIVLGSLIDCIKITKNKKKSRETDELSYEDRIDPNANIPRRFSEADNYDFEQLSSKIKEDLTTSNINYDFE